MEHNWDALQTLFISALVVFIILGGPFTLFAVIKIANSILAGLKVRFVRVDGSTEAPLGLMISWDPESYPLEVFRIKVDFSELVKGGRSTSFSFTLEDKSAKKRSFLVPMKLAREEILMLTDAGLASSARALARSYVVVEIEDTKGQTVRKKFKKKDILEALAESATVDPKEIDVMNATAPDTWGHLSRVFPWRAVVATGDAVVEKKHVAKKVAGGAPKVFDFLISKVWIEPGCIVCDACENEAPAVFHVLADTCIVRENAPMDDVASIVAAAEGCPVDVIKYDRVAKSA